jgi:hypothetical protein
MLPALSRLPDIRALIDGKNYFILYSPRQSGKTTVINAAVDRINDEGKYCALYHSLKSLSEITDKDEAMSMLIGDLEKALNMSDFNALQDFSNDSFWLDVKAKSYFKYSSVSVWLNSLCKKLDKDLVVFFDDTDCLNEQVLFSFLSQLRKGFTVRDTVPFPRSIALIGLRYIRGYNVKLRDESGSLGPIIPFNIITEALTLDDFTLSEIRTLYVQHTEATTGQVFEEGAIQRTWHWSEGQPWLVNALTSHVVEKILDNDHNPAITAGHIDQAADYLIRRRGDTHIDSLMALISEPG